MITPAPRRQNGFTLVELLVVIAIIAVLAKVGFSAGVSAIQKAKKTTALATCVALETAVNNFYTEYGSMPKDALTADTQVEVATTADLALLNALLGIETITTPLNTRAIKFLSVKEGKANKNGLIYNAAGTAVTGLYDPWGGTYFVMLDGNYDEKVLPTGVYGAPTLNGRRAAAFTKGADKLSTTAANAADDVKTW
ncbi:MAG: prepilin-type N-terminal cleavage/methylation domain-containing protein [Verrucomicrobiota bacterium]